MNLEQINELARPEGWEISQVEGTEQTELLLQRVKDPSVFEHDYGAWEHVVTKTLEGSELHSEALMLIAAESPGEIEDIAAMVPMVHKAIYQGFIRKLKPEPKPYWIVWNAGRSEGFVTDDHDDAISASVGSNSNGGSTVGIAFNEAYEDDGVLPIQEVTL